MKFRNVIHSSCLHHSLVHFLLQFLFPQEERRVEKDFLFIHKANRAGAKKVYKRDKFHLKCLIFTETIQLAFSEAFCSRYISTLHSFPFELISYYSSTRLSVVGIWRFNSLRCIFHHSCVGKQKEFAQFQNHFKVVHGLSPFSMGIFGKIPETRILQISITNDREKSKTLKFP